VAFHELDSDGQVQSLPIVPLWQQTGDWIRAAFQDTVPHRYVTARLIELFSRAGLPVPTLFCESPIGGGKDSPLYTRMAETLESFLPQLVKMRILPEDTIAIETFEARLRAAAVEAPSQVFGPAQVCAWTGV
jgi:hypothetical protein